MDVRPEHRDRILAAISLSVLEVGPRRLQRTQKLLTEILAFSRRHKEGTERWLKKALEQEKGNQRQGVVAMTPSLS